MPTTVKCTAMFGSDEGWGWSESHCIEADDVPGPLLPYLQAFDQLIQDKRRPLLGKDRYITGLRVSFRTTTGGIASSNKRFAPLLYSGNQRDGSAPHLAAKVRMGEAENQQFSDIYLRGFWDAVERDEELNFNGEPGAAWKALLDQYTAALVAGSYGWEGMVESLTRRGNVVGYTPEVDGFVTFNLQSTSGPVLPAIGTLLPFRAARINSSKSSLNRSCIVRVTGVNTVETVQRTAALPFLSAGTYVIPATGFVQYTGSQYTVLARRAAGRPFFHSPGRARALARG